MLAQSCKSLSKMSHKHIKHMKGVVLAGKQGLNYRDGLFSKVSVGARHKGSLCGMHPVLCMDRQQRHITLWQTFFLQVFTLISHLSFALVTLRNVYTDCVVLHAKELQTCQ